MAVAYGKGLLSKSVPEPAARFLLPLPGNRPFSPGVTQVKYLNT